VVKNVSFRSIYCRLFSSSFGVSRSVCIPFILKVKLLHSDSGFFKFMAGLTLALPGSVSPSLPAGKTCAVGISRTSDLTLPSEVSNCFLLLTRESSVYIVSIRYVGVCESLSLVLSSSSLECLGREGLVLA